VSVTYTAVLDVSEDSVLFLSGLLHAERVRRGTRTDTRALSTYNRSRWRWRRQMAYAGTPADRDGLGRRAGQQEALIPSARA
jgi:hypothetical protein